MKQVIDGKMYNTDTAEELHEWDNRCFPNDFNYCYESLHRTKKGAYFLYGKGGANTEYSQQYGNNSFSGSSRLTPLTRDEAVRWLEEHDGTDVIEEHFSDLIEEA